MSISYIYWIAIALSGLVCGVAYTFTPKPDVVVIELLGFFSASTAVMCLFSMQRSQSTEYSLLRHAGRELDFLRRNTRKNGTNTQENLPFDDSGSIPGGRSGWVQNGRRCSGIFFISLKILNRILKGLHWISSILFIVGAIGLALSYRFSNP